MAAVDLNIYDVAEYKQKKNKAKAELHASLSAQRLIKIEPPKVNFYYISAILSKHLDTGFQSFHSKPDT